MTRKFANFLIAAGFCVFFSFVQAQANTPEIDSPDYSRLLYYIHMEDLQSPLVLFEDQDGDFDKTLNQENIAYLNQNKELLKRISSRLKGQTLKWHLASSSKRLLVVPERRTEYAWLFDRYCHEVVDYVLKRTRLPNPYLGIATLEGELPPARDDAPRGITAYLVHNIADEYVEEYVFYTQDDDSTKIKIKLRNRVFNGKIGSYTSDLKIGPHSSFEFVREPYTLWQNSARDPLNVFIAPVEETLHISVRGATEKAIRENLKRMEPKTLQDVQNVVNDWMAVEEAIVGGLVNQLMPDIFTRFLHDPSVDKMAAAMAARDEHVQYRYLHQGIQVVNDLGLEPAIHLYLSDPGHFKTLMANMQLAAAPTQTTVQ